MASWRSLMKRAGSTWPKSSESDWIRIGAEPDPQPLVETQLLGTSTYHTWLLRSLFISTSEVRSRLTSSSSCCTRFSSPLSLSASCLQHRWKFFLSRSPKTVYHLKWNSWTAFLIESSFCAVSNPNFSLLQNAFLQKPPVERTENSMEQKTRVFCQIDVQELHLWIQTHTALETEPRLKKIKAIRSIERAGTALRCPPWLG